MVLPVSVTSTMASARSDTTFASVAAQENSTVTGTPLSAKYFFDARRGEVLSNTRARELLGVGRDGATRALRRLVVAGLLEQSGHRGGTRYRLARDLAPPAGLHLSREELLAIVVEMAQEQPVTNSSIRDRTGLDRQDVLSLLDELVRSGRLRRVGERRGTRYLPS